METKEIQVRLEIIKLATTIGDHDIISVESEKLSSIGSKKIDEIVSLLSGKNYRQALYLIKNYLKEMGANSEYEVYEGALEDGENVLDIEDMLRMSPLAKDTIKDYKRSIYTSDDLESFSKNIEKPIKQEYEQNIIVTDDNESSTFIKDIEDVAKENIKAQASENVVVYGDDSESKELANAIESADSDTPLDEISAEVLGKKSKKRNGLSKYKKLREKFARKDSMKSSDVAKSVIESAKESIEPKDEAEDNRSDIKDDSSINRKIESVFENIVTKDNRESETLSRDDDSLYFEEDESFGKEFNGNENKSLLKEEAEDKRVKEDITNIDETKEDRESISEKKEIKGNIKVKDNIYAPVPHIEQKFRQSFVLYPPVKESEIWVEEAVKFLKTSAVSSFTDADVKILLDEYRFYLDKNDIAKAAQLLLLAASTDSKMAQFLLARELFNGKILVRDLNKSFDIMKNLANNFYPDAVCDLAQFYEYGIGVPKDKAVAIKLYEKAFQLGVARASKHIDRLKESSGILSTIFKLK